MLTKNLFQSGALAPTELERLLIELKEEVNGLYLGIKDKIASAIFLLGNPLVQLQSECLELYYTIELFQAGTLKSNLRSKEKLTFIVKRFRHWFYVLKTKFTSINER